MENERFYKIGDSVEANQVEKIAEGITKKALKVIETSGNLWASRIIEKKDMDTFEDLKQEVIIRLIENNYIITKECYRVVNKYMYNYKMHKMSNVEIIVNDDNDKSNVDFESYIQWISESQSYYEVEPTQKACNFRLNDLKLTDRQREILDIYSKYGVYERVAEFLGISRQGVECCIKAIKQKALKHCQSIEF